MDEFMLGIGTAFLIALPFLFARGAGRQKQGRRGRAARTARGTRFESRTATGGSAVDALRVPLASGFMLIIFFVLLVQHTAG